MSLENYSDFLLNFSVCDVNGKNRHFYQFKSFRLDVEERQLLDNGLPVPLMPRVFDVLAVLVERNGHLVEKNELLNTVWADAFVEEANIARIIHELRKVLGEDKNGNKFIETVAKKGYRFVAEVTEVPFGDADDDTATQKHGNAKKVGEKSSRPRVATSPRLILFVVGFLTAVFLLVLLSFNFQSTSSTNPNKIKSIAVLPLKPIGAANRDELYEVGIADSLITKLGAMKGFVVRPLSATRKYSDIEQDPIAAGREQKVDYVLAANYQLANGKMRVTAQFFNVASRQIEETKIIEKDAGDVFALQDAIAGEIGNVLLARFATTESNFLTKRGTTNEEAYRFYLQGRSLMNQRSDEDVKKAVEYFEQAIRLDSNFARGYSSAALAYDFLGKTEKAKEYIKRALELDSNLAEVYAVRGKMNFSVEWNFDSSEKDLLRAIELEPNKDLAHWAYALLLAYRGRFDEAIREIEIALTIAPATVMYSRDRARILYYARRYDEAIAQFKQAIEVDEKFGSVWGQLWMAYEMNGNGDEAYQTFIKWKEISKDENLEDYQKAYAAGGWLGVKRKILEFDKRAEHEPGTNFFAMARGCATLGEKEQAFEYLNKAFEKRQFQMVLLNVEPQLDNLRDDPRFDDLVRRVGF